MTWEVKYFEDEDLIQIFDGDQFILDMKFYRYKDDNSYLAEKISHIPDWVRLGKMIESFEPGDNFDALKNEAINLLKEW
jgi:hypothetical protein